jgi:predicted hydrocarbon binding protein
MPARTPSDSSSTDAALSHRASEGAVFLPDGRRVAAWPQIFLGTLHRHLAAASPDVARQTLYRVGFEWGLQELVQLSLALRKEIAGSNLDLWQMDAAFVFDRWSAPLAAAGWGTWTFDRSPHAKGITVVELNHSAVVAALGAGATKEPACHLYAGLFAGALSFYDRNEAHAVETTCAALGDGACKFLVAPAAVIDQAETARHGGAKHDDILRAALAPATPPPAPATPAKPAKIPWGKK